MNGLAASRFMNNEQGDCKKGNVVLNTQSFWKFKILMQSPADFSTIIQHFHLLKENVLGLLL